MRVRVTSSLARLSREVRVRVRVTARVRVRAKVTSSLARLRSERYRPMKSGICASAGRQPARGLTW